MCWGTNSPSHAFNFFSSAWQAGLLPVLTGPHARLAPSLAFVTHPLGILDGIFFWFLSFFQFLDFPKVFQGLTFLFEGPASAPTLGPSSGCKSELKSVPVCRRKNPSTHLPNYHPLSLSCLLLFSTSETRS